MTVPAAEERDDHVPVTDHDLRVCRIKDRLLQDDLIADCPPSLVRDIHEGGRWSRFCGNASCHSTCFLLMPVASRAVLRFTVVAGHRCQPLQDREQLRPAAEPVLQALVGSHQPRYRLPVAGDHIDLQDDPACGFHAHDGGPELSAAASRCTPQPFDKWAAESDQTARRTAVSLAATVVITQSRGHLGLG